MDNRRMTTNIDSDLAYFAEIKKLKAELKEKTAALEKIRDFNYGKPCCDILKGFARKALTQIERSKP